MIPGSVSEKSDPSEKGAAARRITSALWLSRWLALIDLGLVVTTLLMALTPATVLLFHLIFVWLTLGAFFWKFRAFVVRAGLWVTAATATVLGAVLTGHTQAEELVEIPLLVSILLLVFIISERRASASQQLEQAIAEHRQAEETLSRSEVKFRTLVEQLPAITYVAALDETKVRLYVSPQIETLLGFSPAEWLADPDLWRRQLHPDDRERVLAESARFYATGEPFVSEYRTLARDGREVWFRDEAVIVRDPTGRPQFIQGVKLNITERKQAEARLRGLLETSERQARYVGLLNHMTQAALETGDFSQMLQKLADQLGELFEADGCFITLWDEAQQRVIPAAAYGPLRERYAAFTPLPGEATLTASVLETGRVLAVEDVFDTPYLSRRIAEQFPTRSLLGLPLIAGGRGDAGRGDASSRPLLLGAALVAFNRPHHFTPEEIARGEQAAGQIALAIAKAQLLQAVLEERSRLQALIESSHDGIILINMNQRVLVANAPALALLCLSGQPGGYVNQPIERALAELRHSAPVAMRATLAEIRRVRRGDEPPGEGEYTIPPHIIHWQNLPVLGGAEPLGRLIVLHDITERKRAEEALQEANAKLTLWLGESEQRNRERSLLNEMGNLLQSCLTAQEAYRIIETIGPQLFPEGAGAVYMVSASRNVVEAGAAWGSLAQVERVFTPDDCWALRRGRIHRFDARGVNLPCPHLAALPPSASLCAPMLAQGETLGVLHLRPAAVEASRLEAEGQLAQTVADSLALALANLRLRETLRQQSIRDPLTGLFNRRYLEETLEREARRAARTQRPFGIIMLDLDHFKRFNDTFGHAAGDVLLRELGGFLQQHIRGGDIACRYGGEEFTLVLPEASLEVTRERAEHLREGAKHLHVQHGGQLLGTITLSLGVAAFPQHGVTGEEVLRAADAALYRAKRGGRDRAVAAE